MIEPHAGQVPVSPVPVQPVHRPVAQHRPVPQQESLAGRWPTDAPASSLSSPSPPASRAAPRPRPRLPPAAAALPGRLPWLHVPQSVPAAGRVRAAAASTASTAGTVRPLSVLPLPVHGAALPAPGARDAPVHVPPPGVPAVPGVRVRVPGRAAGAASAAACIPGGQVRAAANWRLLRIRRRRRRTPPSTRRSQRQVSPGCQGREEWEGGIVGRERVV